jgi:hypothetical protein
MLRPDLRDVRVYLHGEPVDMRRQRNGLAALVRAVINQGPFGNGPETGILLSIHIV